MLPESLSKHLLDIYDIVSLVAESDDMDEVAAIFIGLDNAKREIAEMHEQVKNRLIELMGQAPEYRTEDYIFEKKNGAARKSWDHQTLGKIVAQRIIDMSTDMDTGELTCRPIDLAIEMLTFAAPSYWRVGELNKIGVNADNYCEVGEPKTNIIIRKAS